MEIGDVLTIGLILLGAWFILPRAVRDALAVDFRPLLAAAWGILCAVERGARTLVVGKPLTHGEISSAPEEGTPAPHYVAQKSEPPNERTNEPYHVAVRTKLHASADALRLDRTRAGLVRTLVAAHWNVSEIRGVLKGTAADIGEEVKAAKAALDREIAPLPADAPEAWEEDGPGRIVRVA